MNTFRLLSISIALAVCIAASGCQSSKATIDRRAQRIGALAEATIGELDAAVETGEVGPAALSHIDSARANQHEIKGEASKARAALHGVEDITPWWGLVLGNLVIALALAGLVVLLWQTGIGQVIKRLCYAIGFFIPRGTKASAALDAEAIVHGRACPEQREAIAAKRAADPAYEAEFLRQKVRAQRETVAARQVFNKEVVT